MTKGRLVSHAADVLCAVVSFVAGLVAALYFHGKWFNGGWMMLFGDPPMGNPSYSRFAPMFEAAPYIGAGLVAGLLAGFGRFQLMRLVVRTFGPILLFLLLWSRDTHFCRAHLQLSRLPLVF